MRAAVNPSSLHEGYRSNFQSTKRPVSVPSGRLVSPRLVHENPTDDVTGLGRRKIPTTKQKPTNGSNVRVVYPRVVNHGLVVDGSPIDGDVLFVGKHKTIFGSGSNRVSQTMTWRSLNVELQKPENMLSTSDPSLIDRVVAVRQKCVEDIAQAVEHDINSLGQMKNLQPADGDFYRPYIKNVELLDCAEDIAQLARRARNLGEPLQIDPWFDWMAVPTFRKWTMDGVLHNSEFAKDIINEVYPSSIDDNVLLNVAVQGPCHVRNNKHEKNAQFFDGAASAGDTLFMCIVATPAVAGTAWTFQLKPTSSRELCILMQGGVKTDNLPNYYVPGQSHSPFVKFDLLLIVGAWKIGTVLDNNMVVGVHGKINVAVSIEFISTEKMWQIVGNREIASICEWREIRRQQVLDAAAKMRDAAEQRRLLQLEQALRAMIARRRGEQIVREQLEQAIKGGTLGALAAILEKAAQRARGHIVRWQEVIRKAVERQSQTDNQLVDLRLPNPADYTALVLVKREPESAEAYRLRLMIGRMAREWATKYATLKDYEQVRRPFTPWTFSDTPFLLDAQNLVARNAGRFDSAGRPLLVEFGQRPALTIAVAAQASLTEIAATRLSEQAERQRLHIKALRTFEAWGGAAAIDAAFAIGEDPATDIGGCAAYGTIDDDFVTVQLCERLRKAKYRTVDGAKLLRFERPAPVKIGEEMRIVVDDVEFDDILQYGDEEVQVRRIKNALLLLMNVPYDEEFQWQLDRGFNFGKSVMIRTVADSATWQMYDTCMDNVVDDTNVLSLVTGLPRSITNCMVALALVGSCRLDNLPGRLINQAGASSLVQWEGGSAPSDLLQLGGMALSSADASALDAVIAPFNSPIEQLRLAYEASKQLVIVSDVGDAAMLRPAQVPNEYSTPWTLPSSGPSNFPSVWRTPSRLNNTFGLQTFRGGRKRLVGRQVQQNSPPGGTWMAFVRHQCGTWQVPEALYIALLQAATIQPMGPQNLN